MGLSFNYKTNFIKITIILDRWATYGFFNKAGKLVSAHFAKEDFQTDASLDF